MSIIKMIFTGYSIKVNIRHVQHMQLHMGGTILGESQFRERKFF